MHVRTGGSSADTTLRVAKPAALFCSLMAAAYCGVAGPAVPRHGAVADQRAGGRGDSLAAEGCATNRSRCGSGFGLFPVARVAVCHPLVRVQDTRARSQASSDVRSLFPWSQNGVRYEAARRSGTPACFRLRSATQLQRLTPACFAAVRSGPSLHPNASLRRCANSKYAAS
jgi:hypothetical protein